MMLCYTENCERDRRGTSKYCSACYSFYNEMVKCKRENCEEKRYYSHSYCRPHYIEYRKNRPEYSRRRRNTQLKGLYGITLNEFEKRVELNGNKCEICSQIFIKDSKGLLKASVDHNHITGEIRGIICNTCNLTLGRIKEDKQVLINMIQYLEKYESSETLRQTSQDEDKVRTVQRCTELGRNDLAQLNYLTE